MQEASKVYKELMKEYHSQGIGIWKEEDQG
ncbi:hypothetical protein ACVLD2_004365 [Paenibacillus sp. PvR052]